MSSLVDAYNVVFRATGDPVMTSNIMDEAITQAGEINPAALSPLMAKFMSIGTEIGGLTPAESAGFVAGATGLGLPNEEAVTGLKNVVYAIRGRGTPEGNKILAREGISRDDVKLALRQMNEAVSSGQITPAELESIGGKEAAPRCRSRRRWRRSSGASRRWCRRVSTRGCWSRRKRKRTSVWTGFRR